MKISRSILSLALASSAIAAPTLQAAGSAQQPPLAYPIGFSGGQNARVAGRVFDIDGKVQYFAGSNAWWLAHLQENSDVDTVFAEVANTGYKILRVWGFGNVNEVPDLADTDLTHQVYFQVLNSTGGYINWASNGIPRLDYVVHSAEKHGIKLVLPFVNNWDDYGGINSYSAAFGSNATTFYTDGPTQKAYKNYIKTLVTRYRSSPAVFAWELCNEPRCHGCDSSVVTTWATGISQYIKSLDPNHLVTLGDEGWLAPADGLGDGSYAYSGAEGVDFVANLKIKTLDYGVFHLYPNSWGYNYTWGSEWIAQHDLLGAKAGKPVILEEYGTPFPHNHTGTEAPWQEAVLDSGLAADQIWQFATPDLSVPVEDIIDVNSIFYNDTEYKTLAREHAASMEAKWVW